MNVFEAARIRFGFAGLIATVDSDRAPVAGFVPDVTCTF
jgi:hypothetical protein